MGAEAHQPHDEGKGDHLETELTEVPAEHEARPTNNDETESHTGESGSNDDDDDEGAERGRWSSMWTFLLAAIGSAVGLGNFWRFPYLVFKHGGGPFLIPYTLSLFGIGIPMLLLELAMGQKFQVGDVAAFGRIHPKLRGIGYASVFVSFLVVTYYMVIISWTLVYLVESFTMPWAGDAVPCAPASGSTELPRETWHFKHETLHVMNADCTMVGQGVGDSSMVSERVVGALCFAWVVVAGSVIYGVKSASKVVWITMPLPFVLAVVLFFRAVTLEGARDGVEAYIGSWDFEKLREPSIWTDAVAQIFFTLGVAAGIMTSYGSYRPKDQSLVGNVFTIAITNCTFSFFCGFIVFGILGYMAHDKTERCRETCPPGNMTCYDGCTVKVEDVTSAGFTLVFEAFPTALNTMGDAGYFFSVVTFLTLFTLGWDSAFSFMEAITTVIMDSPAGARTVREALVARVGERFAQPLVTVAVAAVALTVGILFCADVGLYWLDLIDHYVSSYTMLLDGLLQAVAVGWVWSIPPMSKRMGRKAAVWFVVTALVATVVLIVLTSTLALPMAPCDTQPDGKEVCYTGGELAIGFAAFFMVLIPGWLKSFLESGMGVGDWFGTAVFAGTEELWGFISAVGQVDGVGLGEGRGTRDFFGTLFKTWWCFCMKFLSPVVLSFLLVLTLKKDVRDPYEGYQRWMNNTMWVCCVTFSLCIFIIFAALPGEFGDIEPNPTAADVHKRELRRKAKAKASEREPTAEEQQTTEA